MYLEGGFIYIIGTAISMHEHSFSTIDLDLVFFLLRRARVMLLLLPSIGVCLPQAP